MNLQELKDLYHAIKSHPKALSDTYLQEHFPGSTRNDYADIS